MNNPSPSPAFPTSESLPNDFIISSTYKDFPRRDLKDTIDAQESCTKQRRRLQKENSSVQRDPLLLPKDKGKNKIEERKYSESEDDDIPQIVKKFKQLESDEVMARKIQEENGKLKEERNRIAEEKATNEALIKNFDDIKARIEADIILAEKLQEQEREQFTIEERAKFLHDTICCPARKFPCSNKDTGDRPSTQNHPTKNQLRNQMMTYLKHVVNFKAF
ncbi:hypothetical protein Tco_1092850 [Tanacetum coccineum]|uniref:Uncharacterized protein n=1 Tax=Tanacetum coccineum TaxID=301880 RepID=A0ABQ5ID08_9ASTR